MNPGSDIGATSLSGIVREAFAGGGACATLSAGWPHIYPARDVTVTSHSLAAAVEPRMLLPLAQPYSG
jgi:hypothetical protein